MQPSPAPDVPSTEAAPGLALAGGRYRLVRQLGRGGYGRVWLAEDSRLGVDVAVKEVAVPPGNTAGVTAEMIERAVSEARNAAQLRDDPHIVTVYDVFVERGVPWTVMQYVPGRSLADEVELNGPVPVPVVQRVAVAMLSALSACHRAGVIHRDVKPHNIMLAENGTPILTDFGIAKGVGQATLTAEGMVAGSMAYIAPERARGHAATPASDLFSLGVTLFHAVEGVSPFDRGSGIASLSAVLQDDLPEPVRAGSLATVIKGLTAKDPTLRLTAEQAAALLHGRPSMQTREYTSNTGPPHHRVDKMLYWRLAMVHRLAAARGVDPEVVVAGLRLRSPDGKFRRGDILAEINKHTPPLTDAEKARKKARDSAVGVGAFLVGVLLIGAAFDLAPKLSDSNVPDDALDMATARVGDCVGTTSEKGGWYVVPCWYAAATYRVIDVGLWRNLGNNNTTRADAVYFCQSNPGWDPAGRVEPAYPNNYTVVTVCLVPA